MRKAICPKCNKVVNVDEKENNVECPECHELIFAEQAMKAYGRTYTVTKRKAEISMINTTNYAEAYKQYKNLLLLDNTNINSLFGAVLACLYTSNMQKITIREATNLLLKGSDNIEISKNNITTLSDFLTKMREDSKKIINAFKPFKEQSNYALKMYQTSLNEYIYFIDAYIQIFDSLDKLNPYLKEGKELLNDELKFAKEEVAKEVKVINSNSEPHKFIGLDNKEIIDIFPNKQKAYKITMSLFIVMGIGFILSIVGLVLFSNKNIANAAKISTLSIGLAFFIGGYFLRHYLVDKFYKKN